MSNLSLPQLVKKSYRRTRRIVSLALILIHALTVSVASASAPDMSEMSLEDLMNVRITSVSKKNQRLSHAAAAAFVITQEDIRRSGVRSIPEALRMAPGLHVAKVDGNVWAITARGFNARLANKLLVLMDGRTVYDPLFSGVFWDILDYPLEDIERIEVIRGPGGTIWGANAVNGVINIITKNAKDTKGGFVSAGGGTEEKGFGDIRYGWQMGDTGAARIYVQGNERDESIKLNGNDHNDAYKKIQGGFRADWQTDKNTFSLHGSLYNENAGQTSRLPSELAAPEDGYRIINIDDTDVEGGYGLARWESTTSEISNYSLQFYYDQSDRTESIGRYKRQTYDIEYTHRLQLGTTNELMWGLEYRYNSIEMVSTNAFNLDFDAQEEGLSLYSGFVQDELALRDNRLTLTIGSKFEHNPYTDLEIQPSVRMLWAPDDRQSTWLAASRAVRTPSKYENDVRVPIEIIPPPMPMMPAIPVNVNGNDDLDTEEVLALEAGYRRHIQDALVIDIAAYVNFYDNLQTLAPINEADPTNQIIKNEASATSYGFELAAEWKPRRWWMLRPAYSYQQLDIDTPDNASNFSNEDDTPEHIISLRSEIDLPWNLEFDLWFRHVSTLNNVDSYSTADARLAMRPTPNLEISLVGQNLLEDLHEEWSETQYFTESTQVERGVYLKFDWRY